MPNSSSTLLYEYPPTAHSLLLLRSRVKQKILELFEDTPSRVRDLILSRVLNDLVHLKEGLAFLSYSSLLSDSDWWSWVELLHPKICAFVAAGEADDNFLRRDQSLSCVWSDVLLEIYYQTLTIESELEEQVLRFYSSSSMYVSEQDDYMSCDEEDYEEEDEEEEGQRKRGEKVKSSLRIILTELGLCEDIMTENSWTGQLCSLQDVADYLMLQSNDSGHLNNTSQENNKENVVSSLSGGSGSNRKRRNHSPDEEEQHCVKYRLLNSRRLEQQPQHMILDSTNWKSSITA